MDRVSGTENAWKIGVAAAVGVVGVAAPAHAIPSPELVIGSVSSLGQVFALGAAMLGGGAAFAGRRFSTNPARAQNSRTLVRVAGLLFLVALASGAANIWQMSTAKSDRLARLQATLTRPAQFDGTKIKDKNLIETSFEAQSSNPLAISTAEAERLLKPLRPGAQEILFLDVREDAENQMGTLPNSRHVRFPDLASANLDLANKKVVLFCYNGNRSSETCEKLAAMGIDCKFIAGGIEKWIVEGRPFTDKTVRDLSNLRAIPAYENRDVLLDTSEVKDLLANEDVQFLDVRYPGDFSAQHLPGAINIPLRALPTAQLNQAIAKLPRKPVVAACYDRRSCFISQVLGLELTRAGFDFRGRYTVPWEYFIPKKPKPHVAAWLAESRKTYWQKTVEALADALVLVAQKTHIILAVFLLALASRVLILPIALKAERDQIVTAKTKHELKDIKARLKQDPPRLTRAIQDYYKTNGLTPMRNLLALAFLPLMMLGLAAVEKAGGRVVSGLLWAPEAGQPDPTFLLPAAFAVLGATYLQLALVSSRRGLMLCWLLGAPVLFLMVFRLTALGNLYLCFALLLLLVQRAYVTGWIARVVQNLLYRMQDWQIRVIHKDVVPLRATAHLTGCGNKAFRLSRMLDQGIDVPGGVVLTDAYLRKFTQTPPQLREKALDNIWTMSGGNLLAVRSSAAAEDGENQSFAGVFESELDIDRASLGAAIDRVHASFSATKVTSYAEGDPENAYNILIQQMVAADYAGVLFSRDPQAAGMMVLEYVAGTADDLVSGRVTPTRLQIARSGDISTAPDCPFDVSTLHRIGLRLEALFGKPQDIEWAVEGGKIRIVQSRDITTFGLGPLKDRALFAEWQSLTDRFAEQDGDATVLELDEMSEVLPRPTPLSLSYMQEIWAPGGSVDLACRSLGLRYGVSETHPSHLVSMFGRLYADVRQKAGNAVNLSPAVAKKLDSAAGQIETDFRTRFLADYGTRLQLLDSTDFSKLSPQVKRQQLAEIYDDFIHGTHVEVEIINIAASYYMQSAQTYCAAHGIVAQDVLSPPVSFSPSGLWQQASAQPLDQRRSWLQTQMGHRSVFDYELSEPRYSETPDTLDMLLGPILVENSTQKPERQIDLPQDPIIQHARQFQALKEEAKHQALRHLAVIRRAVRALDPVYGDDGLVFYLTFEELLDQHGDVPLLIEQAIARREHLRILNALPSLPSRLTRVQLEQASSPSAHTNRAARQDGGGEWVSGNGPVVGRAYVVSPAQAESGAPLAGFQTGDILLCAMVHPAWLAHVLQASAVVSEVGGWLSHMSIVARENNVAMLVGARGVADYETGHLIEVDTTGIKPVLTEAPAKVMHIAE